MMHLNFTSIFMEHRRCECAVLIRPMFVQTRLFLQYFIRFVCKQSSVTGERTELVNEVAFHCDANASVSDVWMLWILVPTLSSARVHLSVEKNRFMEHHKGTNGPFGICCYAVYVLCEPELPALQHTFSRLRPQQRRLTS